MIEVSQKQNIFFQWLSWQFWEAPVNILKAWRNFLLFNLNYFSILLLLTTFFAHWRKYKWSYGRGFDPKVYFEAFASNLISRLLGATVRLFLIITGIVVEIFLIFGGLLVFLAWLIMPFFLILGIYHGFRILL